MQDLRLHLIKKGTLSQVFSCQFCKVFKNTFLTEQFPTASIYRSSDIDFWFEIRYDIFIINFQVNLIRNHIFPRNYYLNIFVTYCQYHNITTVKVTTPLLTEDEFVFEKLAVT